MRCAPRCAKPWTGAPHESQPVAALGRLLAAHWRMGIVLPQRPPVGPGAASAQRDWGGFVEWHGHRLLLAAPAAHRHRVGLGADVGVFVGLCGRYADGGVQRFAALSHALCGGEPGGAQAGAGPAVHCVVWVWHDLYRGHHRLDLLFSADGKHPDQPATGQPAQARTLQNARRHAPANAVAAEDSRRAARHHGGLSGGRRAGPGGRRGG